MKRACIAAVLTASVACGVLAQDTPRIDDVAGLVNRYVTALGGRPALDRVTMHVMRGKLVVPGGEAPLTVYQATPSRFLVIIDSPVSGISRNGYDGRTAWSENEKGSREVTGAEAGVVMREYDIRWAVRLKEVYTTLALAADTLIDGRRLHRIDATSAEGTREQLFFDASTGLLARRDVMGPMSLSLEFSDYRPIAGVLVPFSVRHSRPGFSWTNRYRTMEDGVPVPDSLFAMPKARLDDNIASSSRGSPPLRIRAGSATEGSALRVTSVEQRDIRADPSLRS